MKILKNFLYILLVVIIGATATYFAYNTFVKANNQSKDGLYIIPQNASVVFASSNYSNLRSLLEDENKIWAIFKKDLILSNQINMMDSIWKKTRFLTTDSTSEPKVYYSIHYSGNNNYNTLLSISFKSSISNDLIEKEIAKYSKTSKREFEGNIIFSFVQNKKKYFILNIYNNICISGSESTIERIILEQNAETELKNTNIDKMLKISGKDAYANIYVNYKYFYRIISSLASNEYTNLIKQLSEFTQFSVLDANINSNNISLNGYSYTLDTASMRLNTYANYNPPTINIFNNVPSNTTFIYYQGAEELNNFLKEQSGSKYNVQNLKSIKKYQADFMIDLSKHFYPWIKSELAFCLLSNTDDNGNPNSFAIMNTYDIKETIQSLDKLTDIICEQKNITITTDTFRTFEIKEIPIPHLLEKVFGNLFNPLQNSFYTYTNDYVIFANSKSTLKKHINSILVENTLANRDAFAEFKESLSNESHIMIYANSHFSNSISNALLNKSTIEYLEKSKFDIQKLGDVCLQFIVNNNGAFTSLNINTNDITELEDNNSWQIALDYEIAAGPFLIKNHITKTNDILLFDVRNTMYRISSKGKIEWAIPVAEIPIGTPQVVDYYKNNKYQFLYNSKNNIYLYDLNGNTVENYPIKLENEATAALSLVNYDNQKKYRILIPQSDGLVHNYQIDGSTTKGWLLPSMPSLISKPVQHYVIEKKDFILLADTAGNVVFSNRKGEARIETKLAFTNNINTEFYRSGNFLLTTDKVGRLIFIDKLGKVEKTLFREFSSNHEFYLMDITGDKNLEYVYYDLNTIYVYNNEKELLWSNTIDYNLLSKPIATNNLLKDSSSFILYNSSENIFEFGLPTGVLNRRDDFIGSQFYITYKATNSDNYRLISVKERIVSNYLLK